jgi:cytochrome c oxidase subunit 1
MSSTPLTPPGVEKMPRLHYLNATYGIRSWLLTTDHKRIALLYLISVTFFFFIGGLFASLIRIHLLTPGGYLVTPETYNKLFTMHGVAMIFFFLIPSIPAVLGNFLIPIMIGAKDLAFPKLNLLSWYIYLLGGAFVLYSFATGGLDTGWTFYTPLSSIYSNSAVTPAVIGIFINGFSTILTGLNFIVTIHTMRAPGMTWLRLPLFVWSHYATSIIFILGTPVIAITLLLAGLERMFHLGFFNPAYGGDPILFQHLFWFYSHPAVYIMILPAMGVISEIIPTFARKPIFGYDFIAASSIGIAVIGFIVWAHHMFLTGQSTYSAVAFSFLTFLVAIPSAVKVFNWTATLYKGSIHRTVHDRRADRTIPRLPGSRYPFARHLLRRRALPLHYGGRRDHGLSGWHPLLVAENYGAALPGISCACCRNYFICRVQPDILSPVYSGLPGNAAPIS